MTATLTPSRSNDHRPARRRDRDRLGIHPVTATRGPARRSPWATGTGKPGNLTYGHFHDQKWAVGPDRLPELFIGGEGHATRPRALLGTLLHEAAHGIAAIRASRTPAAKAATKHLLPRHRHRARRRRRQTASIGWSITTSRYLTARDYPRPSTPSTRR